VSWSIGLIIRGLWVQVPPVARECHPAGDPIGVRLPADDLGRLMWSAGQGLEDFSQAGCVGAEMGGAAVVTAGEFGELGTEHAGDQEGIPDAQGYRVGLDLL
jgi:hypothetical protein